MWHLRQRAYQSQDSQTTFQLQTICQQLCCALQNRSYRWHIVMYVTAFMCMDIISALAVYYATDVWHGYKLFGMDMSSLFIIAPMMVAAVVMFPLARVMMDKRANNLHSVWDFRSTFSAESCLRRWIRAGHRPFSFLSLHSSWDLALAARNDALDHLPGHR